MTTVEPAAPEQLWHEAWAHRQNLLRVARRRTLNEQDAADVVQEALLRAVVNDVAPDVMGAWLTRVVINLCVDVSRERARHPQRVAYTVRMGTTEPPADEAICDRAEADWLAAQAAQLPPRQRQALRLRADSLVVEEVAVLLGTSYKTTESLLARARATLRGRLQSTLGIPAAGVLPSWRWFTSTLAPGGAAATAAVGAVVGAALLLPSAPQPAVPPGSAPRPSAPAPNSATAQLLGASHAAGSQRVPVSRPPARPKFARPAENPSQAGAAPEPDVKAQPRPVFHSTDLAAQAPGNVSVEVTEHDSDEPFEESLRDCVALHATDPLTLLAGTCPPD